jgi:hypothetical protein
LVPNKVSALINNVRQGISRLDQQSVAERVVHIIAQPIDRAGGLFFRQPRVV